MKLNNVLTLISISKISYKKIKCFKILVLLMSNDYSLWLLIDSLCLPHVFY